ncbi:LysR family transcriptional regulator [Sphingomonas sabuli]|uniref:LysR family transcriptional regulator n=1 Tax=Sphingomonas sabuli TaxID=2764186 RepID=A0A7G9L4V5_9SPHN|nr:LysR family transcriptional regulator [Sphingomonas sabuli]QNM83654.1 LysR family transcriptional regulator [Sphingomonas sabuli]
MFDWNDLRHFLAVAREGSTLAAGRTLRVSQTTVARRIAALEASIGCQLFEKRQAGYVLTPAGEDLLETAATVEAGAIAFAEAAGGQARDVSGAVKITTEEIFAIGVLANLLPELRQLHPDIRIELDTSQKVRDLGAGEADISLRSTSKPQLEQSGLVGRRLAVDDWALYCSRDYAARNGVPASIAELRDHPIIGGGGGNLEIQYQAWLKVLGLDDRVAMRHATSGGLLTGVRSGFGIAVLPCVVADGDPDLIQCFPPRPGHGRVLWLYTHERVRHTPRVRTVIDFLYDRISAHIRRLEAKKAA